MLEHLDEKVAKMPQSEIIEVSSKSLFNSWLRLKIDYDLS